MNLRLLVPYPEQRARLGNICFKVILFYGELKTFVGNLGATIGAKLCHTGFCTWVLAMLIELLHFQDVSALSFFPVPKTLGLVLNMYFSPSSRSRMTKICFKVQHRATHTAAAHFNLLLPNFRGMFGEFKAIHALSRAKSTFWKYSLQASTSLCGKPKTLCGKLMNNNRCKISASLTLSRLNISHVDITPAVP